MKIQNHDRTRPQVQRQNGSVDVRYLHQHHIININSRFINIYKAMNQELLFFILTSAFVIVGTTIASWQDKEIIEDNRRADGNFNFLMHKWKFWGNLYALFTISVLITCLIALEHWWYAILWYPIMWLLWWTVHDLTTGWFILGKALHISSDPITQFFARIVQQSKWFYLGMRLFYLYMMLTAYFKLSFDINLTPFPW